MIPTRKDFSKASTHPSGNGFTHEQIRILGADPKVEWLKPLIGTEIPDDVWEAFVRAGDKLREKNAKRYKIQGSVNPAPICQAAAKAASSELHPAEVKAALPKTTFIPSQVRKMFFESEDWKFARAFILRKFRNRCCHCGSGAPDVVLHVDHKIPVTADWSRRLDLLNLQVLCEPCNVGKSNFFVG